MNKIWKDESSDTNDEGNSSSNDPVRQSNHRLNQSRLTFLFDSDSHSSIDNTSPNMKSKEQEQEQEQEPSESSSSSLDSSSPLCDSAMDSIVREQDAHYIQSKYGNQNILLDNDTSFSYATSKLFASIAAAGGAVPDKSDEADIEPDRNRAQVETYCSSKDPSNDRNEEVHRISHASRLVTNPYAKKAKSDFIWNNATRTQIHGSNKRHTEQGQNESKSSGTTAYDRNSNCDSIEPLEKKQMVESQQRESSYPVIHPSFYKPPPFQPKPEPNVHKMNIHTRPIAKRTNISISSLFPASGSSPTKNIVDFWKSKYHSLNHMQTELAHKIVHSEDNIVVSAPTGAGKTCIFEMAMGSLLQSSQTAGSIPKTKKIVYISPSKALCDERYNDWSTRFIQVDPAIEVVVVTGDDNSSGISFKNVASAHVILTTPEKWDSITRKWTDHLALLSSVKLLMIDEVHLLGDESRGSCLETLVCRMKTVQRAASASKEGVQKRNHQR
jgi:superfamily II RNA helicase